MNKKHMYNCLCNTRLAFDSNQKLPVKRANLHSVYSFLDVEAGDVYVVTGVYSLTGL